MLKSFETAKTSMRQGEAWALLAFLRVRNACNMYTYYIHIYIYIYVNGVAAPKHTGSFLSNLQASPASPLWFLPNEEDEEKGSPCDTRRC